MARILMILAIAAIATPAAASMGKIGDFVGIYECPNGPSFELTEDTYTLTGMAPEKIANKLAVEKGIILTLSDGYRFGVWKTGKSEYEWASGESGDAFTCKKVN